MTSKATVQTVVIVLGLITLTLVGGAFVLIATNHAVPDPVWTLAGVGVGSFGSLLASTRSGPESTPVNVVNTPSDPVPVEAAPPVAALAEPDYANAPIFAADNR